jgi:hypothetical protein
MESIIYFIICAYSVYHCICIDLLLPHQHCQWVVNYISECFLKYFEALSILTDIIVNWRCACYIVSKKTNNTY